MGDGDTRALHDTKFAAASQVAPKLIVIVPVDNAWVTGAEKTTVLIPEIVLPVSLFVEYELPAVSLTVTPELVLFKVSVTMMVWPTATVALPCVSVLTDVPPCVPVPILVGPMAM